MPDEGSSSSDAEIDNGSEEEASDDDAEQD